MKLITTYLIFNGNCHQALEFYASVFDGTITELKTFAEASMEVDQQHHQRVFDSQLVANDLILKASDSMPNQEVAVGNNFSLFIKFDNLSTFRPVFNRLADSGSVLMSPDYKQTPVFGMVRDQYNISWMFVFDPK